MQWKSITRYQSGGCSVANAYCHVGGVGLIRSTVNCDQFHSIQAIGHGDGFEISTLSRRLGEVQRCLIDAIVDFESDDDVNVVEAPPCSDTTSRVLEVVRPN